MINSTVNHQKLPFSDPTHPPLWWRNTWMPPNGDIRPSFWLLGYVLLFYPFFCKSEHFSFGQTLNCPFCIMYVYLYDCCLYQAPHSLAVRLSLVSLDTGQMDPLLLPSSVYWVANCWIRLLWESMRLIKCLQNYIKSTKKSAKEKKINRKSLCKMV